MPKAQVLPIKLGKEPLIDVVCEVRFASDGPASVLLPGLLLSKLTGIGGFEALPAAQLPQMLREQDPNLRLAPFMKMTWGEFVIIVGDRSLAVGCKMPYPGWTAFKAAIFEVFPVLTTATFVKAVERHSIKYVDLFPKGDGGDRGLDQFAIALQLGAHTIAREATQIRTEIHEKPFIHAVTVLTAATVHRPDGSKSDGSIVDVDTHRVQEFADVAQFVNQLPELLEEIHDANKQFFFACLSNAGLEELEPIYE